MARTDPQLNFRIPADLKARLEDAARVDGRSLNQELIQRLARSFEIAALEISTGDGNKLTGYADAENLRVILKHQEKALKAQEATIADLREQLAYSKRMMDVVLSSQDLFAGYLLSFYRMLPPEKQDSDAVQFPLRMAEAMLTRDGPRMADEFARIFADDPAVVENMRQLRNELVHETAPTRPLPPALDADQDLQRQRAEAAERRRAERAIGEAVETAKPRRVQSAKKRSQ
jgi:hypothetical protein